MEEKNYIRPISIWTQSVIDRLKKCAIGDFVSWDELSELVCGNIRNGKSYCWSTARKVLLREHRMNFLVIRGEGVQRASDPETIADTKKETVMAHKKFRRALQRMSVVDFEKLPGDQKQEYNVQISVIGALEYATSRKGLEKAEKKILDSSKRLDVSSTLSYFSGI